MPISLHATLGWVLVIATLALVGFWIPPADRIIGESYLIFFFHFPSAINCLNLFLLAGAFSAVHLVRKRPQSDLAAAAAVEVGILATTVTLVTGSIWAKAAWGVWWEVRDPRLMSVAIMWLTYLGYWALRMTIDEPEKRGRFCAVFGVIAAVNVPAVYFSIRVLGRMQHPMEVALSETSMVVTRWFGAGAFLILYLAFWRMRYRVLRAADRMNRMEQRFADSGI